MFSRPFPLGDNRSSAHIAHLTNLINSHTLYAGKGISIVQQHDGMVIKNTDTPRKDTICYRGLYDFNAEYFPFDAVYIDTGATYYDQSGSLLSLTSGFYICERYVPPANNTSTYFITTIVPSYASLGGAATDIEANAYRWYSRNTYYPNNTYSGSESTVADSGYNIQTNVKFWQFLGGGAGVTYAHYNLSSSYKAGTIVLVDYNTHYDIAFTASIGQTFPPMNPGVFYARIDVPDTASRNSYNYYHPFYPYWTGSHETTVSGSKANQIFWEPMWVLTNVAGCKNNKTVWGYGSFFESGSGFQYQLPYTG